MLPTASVVVTVIRFAPTARSAEKLHEVVPLVVPVVPAVLLLHVTLLIEVLLLLLAVPETITLAVVLLTVVLSAGLLIFSVGGVVIYLYEISN